MFTVKNTIFLCGFKIKLLLLKAFFNSSTLHNTQRGWHALQDPLLKISISGFFKRFKDGKRIIQV